MTKYLDWLAQRKKAIAAFVTPGVALLVGNFAVNGSWPTAHEWGAAAVVCVLTALGVHQVPNKPKRTQRGNVDVLLLLSVLTFVGVLLLLFRVHF